jgi:c-di-GMP-binding flagellar brake protein YcgR
MATPPSSDTSSHDDDVFSVPPPAPPPLPHAVASERRTNIRAPYFTPLSILREDGAVIDARSADVSLGGMLVTLPGTLVEAETVVVKFAPPLAARAESLRACVRWVKPDGSRAASQTAGLSFLAVTHDAGTYIAAYAELAAKLDAGRKPAK